MRSALEPLGCDDIKVDCTKKIATFKAPEDLDLDSELEKVADTKQFKGWARQ